MGGPVRPYPSRIGLDNSPISLYLVDDRSVLAPKNSLLWAQPCGGEEWIFERRGIRMMRCLRTGLGRFWLRAFYGTARLVFRLAA